MGISNRFMSADWGEARRNVSLGNDLNVGPRHSRAESAKGFATSPPIRFAEVRSMFQDGVALRLSGFALDCPHRGCRAPDRDDFPRWVLSAWGQRYAAQGFTNRDRDELACGF